MCLCNATAAVLPIQALTVQKAMQALGQQRSPAIYAINGGLADTTAPPGGATVLRTADTQAIAAAAEEVATACCLCLSILGLLLHVIHINVFSCIGLL